jgi:phosphotransferase system  glucose/maltose/N-acetylglucosamine-specific IIC component
VIARLDNTDISEIASGTSDSLTNVMVLHPIECGFAFIAFLLALGHGIVGSLAGALIAFGTWILVLISLAVDFSLFGILHHHVNNDGSGSHAYFGAGIWCLTAAFVTLFLGMIIVFFTCCARTREKRQAKKTEAEAPPVAPRRKRFGIF